jgi:tRNA (uracil-5-)-methyltransferase TRM9
MESNSDYKNIAKQFSNKRQYQWTWITYFIKSNVKNSLILDVGCGNGRNMNYQDYKFIGIDNCEEFVKICKDDGKNVLLSNMTNIPFTDGYFDAIISIASFHHLNNDTDRNQCLQELQRLLKYNGKVLLSVWSIDQHHNKKLNFNYGDNYIPWKNNKGEILKMRYYYIFKLDELSNLLKKYFTIKHHSWIHGNEVFILSL